MTQLAVMQHAATRLWRGDASLWSLSDDDVAAGLGWLHCVDWLQPRVAELQNWAATVAQSRRYERAILIGMGGSSLAAMVFASLFPPASGYPPLTVLDSTDPDAITRVIADGDLRNCLFIVAGKSGGTVETADLFSFFYARLKSQCDDPQTRFVIITDNDSALHKQAQALQIRAFINPSDIGGRYSALSYFGLLPAALLGIDVGEILSRASTFCALTKSDDATKNPALALGNFLGKNARDGRDKLLLRLPKKFAVFGLWIEQLIAESTGKDSKGLLPVIVTDAIKYDGDDCITVRYVDDKTPTENDDYVLRMDDGYQLGTEFFRWEFATAIAAAYLQVNPFDQPDVARSKTQTQKFLCGEEQTVTPIYRSDDYDLYASPDDEKVIADLADFCRTITAGDYLAILAYLPETPCVIADLQRIIADAAAQNIVATVGFAPRYLHSTGQLHKGGAATGRFLQFTADADTDLAIPDRDYTFAQLYRAQADGDFAALNSSAGVVVRVHLKADKLRALGNFVDDFANYLSA